MKTKTQIIEECVLFAVPTGGIGHWLTEQTHDDVFERLGKLDQEPLPAVQLNQLLVLGQEAPVGDGFFRYYWLHEPKSHPYSVRTTPGYSEQWAQCNEIVSLDHLKWGLYRLYVDGLLYFGNVRTAFRKLRDMSYEELTRFFGAERFDSEAIRRRGPALPLKKIAKDNRYLIAEMACKSYGELGATTSDLQTALLEAYRGHVAAGATSPTIRELLDRRLPEGTTARQQEFIFAADDVLDEQVSSELELATKYERIARDFTEARP